MAVVHSAGQPENDGERVILQLLRDRLPDDWHVAANFWLEWRPGRFYECDAAVFSPRGRAHLIEIKAWIGRIRGNDREWELPGIAGEGATYRPNPVKLTQRKAQILREHVRDLAPALSSAYFEALVVLVSDAEPDLEGNFRSQVVLADQLVGRLLGAEPHHRLPDFPDHGAERLADLLTSAARPVKGADEVGAWRLLELVEATAHWETWRAVPRAAPAGTLPSRLKRYSLDPLLTGADAAAQKDVALRDLTALTRLGNSGAQVLRVASVEEADDGFVVVTQWPQGESLEHLLLETRPDQGDARDLFRELLGALASVHRGGVVHRNLSPSCIYLDPDGGMLLADFDYARLPVPPGAVTRYAAELSGDYVAPEVRETPARSSARSDVWSAAKIGLTIFGGLDRVSPDWLPSFRAALEDEPDLRPADADEFLRRLSTSPGLPVEFEANDEIDERYVVRGSPIRTGGLSLVIQVYDSVLETLFAAKFVRPEYRDRVDPCREFELLAAMPDHPGIVKPTFVEVMHSIRRRGNTVSRHETFQLAPWIDGTSLDALVSEHLPAARVLELGAELADVLEHLHTHGLLHRDVKPENVLVLADGHAKLFDFNVSGGMATVGATEVGTVTYRPADVATAGWDASCDVFALCAVLAELLAGRRLSRQEARDQAAALAEPEGLGQLLLEGLAPERRDRLSSAGELRDRLSALKGDAGRVAPPVRRPPPVPVDELVRPNWNAYQHRLLSFFSQSRTSNAGTRGLDDFTDWFYVPTALDDHLTRDVLDGTYQLVVVTGNAGDGKTAFVQRLESELARAGATVATHPDGNGVTARLANRVFLTNWDGSQDEGEETSDRVVTAFFEPFAGSEPALSGRETRVIAINEGRLLDFLESHRAEFPMLASTVERLLDGHAAPDSPWLVLVNLNLRALTSDASPAVPALLALLASEPLWAPCERCVAATTCYARANAKALRDRVLGPRIAERTRKLLDVARLRRRLHITMRDLRSALAFAVVGDRDCSEIVELAQGADDGAVVAGRFYNAIFAGAVTSPAFRPSAARDRLLQLIATLDVARAADPELDGRLWSAPLAEILPHGDSDNADIRYFGEARESARSSDPAVAGVSDLVTFVHASLRRVYFFEREDPGWVSMFPYRSLGTFVEMLEGSTEGALRKIVQAISNSEGRFPAESDARLAVRLVGEFGGSDRTFVVHHATDFLLEPVIPESGLRYIEFQPDTVRLRHSKRAGVQLDVDLDLFETLERVRAGFRPSREELQGAWLNLRVFKEQLGAMPADELLLARGERQFYGIRRLAAEGIQIEAIS